MRHRGYPTVRHRGYRPYVTRHRRHSERAVVREATTTGAEPASERRRRLIVRAQEDPRHAADHHHRTGAADREAEVAAHLGAMRIALELRERRFAVGVIVELVAR